MKDVGTTVYVSERGIDEAIKRFKKRIEKFGILDEFKKRQYYEKPSVARHKAKKSRPKSK